MQLKMRRLLMMSQTAGRRLKLKRKAPCLVNWLQSLQACFASCIPCLSGWGSGLSCASSSLLLRAAGLWVSHDHIVPWDPGQTNRDFQHVSEEITAILAHGGSKNQQHKDPDLSSSCPTAYRDIWGIISHRHFCISGCADCIKQCPL